MAITFPSSPSTGQKFTHQNKVWTWDGNSWKGGVSSGGDAGTLDSLNSTQFLRSDADDTVTGQITFPGNIGSRPVFSNGILARSDQTDTEGTHDIWGISERYYPSNPTAGDAWGIQWGGSPNEINFIGAGEKKFSVDLDTAGNIYMNTSGGNVGIGTTTPDNTLTVNGGTESIGVQISETARLTLGADGTWNYFKGKSGNGHYFNTTGGGLVVLNNAGNVGIGTTSPSEKLDILGKVNIQAGQVWSTGTQGKGRGSIHIDPNSDTDDAGGAITFGASDTSSGTNAHAGIYVRSDGNYGTKMYLSTTDSYAQGSKTAITINHIGNVEINRGQLKLANLTSNPSSPVTGGMYFNTTDNAVRAYDGTDWIQIGRGPLGTQTNPASSATAIINAGDSVGDGLYWLLDSNINNGVAFQAYCDMTKDSGGWILVHTVRGDAISYMGWTTSNIELRNQTAPSLVQPYSILGWSDYLKKTGTWQFMIEAYTDSTTRYRYGGIFTSNVASYSMTANVPTQTNITANQWFDTSGFADSSRMGQRVPWINTGNYSPSDALFTTYPGSSSWWGTITQTNNSYSSYYTGPWYSAGPAAPTWKRVWIR
jgi:hypothetical protein